jgi:putative phosphonate transport system ATP-binding protein
MTKEAGCGFVQIQTIAVSNSSKECLNYELRELSKSYNQIQACDRISFDLYPGQVLGIVGESGSGKSTLLKAIANNITIDQGNVIYKSRQEKYLEITQLPEHQRRWLMRTEWGFVQQNPRDGLRMQTLVNDY